MKNYELTVKLCRLAVVSFQASTNILQRKFGAAFQCGHEATSSILVAQSVKFGQLVEVDPQLGGSLHLAHHERHHRLRHQVQACASVFVGPPLEVIT